MKYSASTLGCPDWDLPTCITKRSAFGFNGIDIRGIQRDLAIWKLPALSSDIASTRTMLADHDLQLSCLSSSIRLTDRDTTTHIEETKHQAQIAAALACNQIRIFGGRLNLFSDQATDDDREDIIAHCADHCRQVLDLALQIHPRIELLIETHDAWTRTDDAMRLLTAIDHPHVALCWDIKHTYWAGGEAPSASLATMSGQVRNTHWKDCLRVDPARYDESIAKMVAIHGYLCPLGDGIVPLADAYGLLADSGYDGWLTLEWEKQWHPHIAEPELAFPGFIRWMTDVRNRQVVATSA